MATKIHMPTKEELAAMQTDSAMPRPSNGDGKTLTLIPTERRVTLSDVLTHCRGIHARVAARVGVDPSYVSRVASGSRTNEQVSRALREELRALSESITSLLKEQA